MTLRRKWVTVLAVALVLTLVPTGTGLAFFSKLVKPLKIVKSVDNQCSQLVQTIESGLGISLDLESTLYDLQEDGVHGTITALTGIAIPHGYINVHACGQTLPIDPPVVYNSVIE